MFKQRAGALGLSEDEIAKFETAGINTLAKMAFACNHMPGSQEETAFLEMVDAVFGTRPSQGTLSCCRRLFFESYTMVAGEMKMRLEQTHESEPRKLALPERAARRAEQVQRLVGLQLDGELDVADCLVDLCIHQCEENQLKWIAWEKCINRAQELQQCRKAVAFKTDAAGNLKVVPETTDGRAVLTTDLRAKQALQRRALAYDQARVISFLVHCRWVERLFDELMRTPPPGFQTVGIDQLMRADQKLFEIMCDRTRDGIQPKSDEIGRAHV